MKALNKILSKYNIKPQDEQKVIQAIVLGYKKEVEVNAVIENKYRELRKESCINDLHANPESNLDYTSPIQVLAMLYLEGVEKKLNNPT